MRKILLLLLIATTVVAIYLLTTNSRKGSSVLTPDTISENEGGSISTEPLSVDRMRNAEYPGSQIEIDQALGTSGNHSEYIASYRSEGLKINALLTIPNGEKPTDGWPVIIFNHGYIPPTEYRTNERYVAYVNGFANRGYIVFKPDYRGHGSSEGNPEGAYFSPAYTTDVLNALGSIKKYKDADPNNIGMWGHSLGGNITQRAVVTSTQIKAAVIWGGVVGTYDDMYDLWFNRRRNTNEATVQQQQQWRMSRTRFTELHGTPQSNPTYWKEIDPAKHLELLKTPIQLHHTKGDETVTYRLSEEYAKELKSAGKEYELYLYEGDDHNISANFSTAMQRSIEFFDKYLKN